MTWKRSFAYLPTKVSPTPFMSDDYWVWLKPYWYIKVGVASSYNPDPRDVRWEYIRRPYDPTNGYPTYVVQKLDV